MYVDNFDMDECFVPVHTARGRVGYEPIDGSGFRVCVEPSDAAATRALGKALKQEAGWTVTDGGQSRFVIQVGNQSELLTALMASYKSLAGGRDNFIKVNRWIPETVEPAALLLIALGLKIPGANRHWSSAALFEKIDNVLP